MICLVSAHVELELWVIKWFAGILGLPPSSSGVLCNGVHSADILCVLTARCTLLRQSDMYNRSAQSPASPIYLPDGCLLLGQPHREWANNNPTLGQYYCVCWGMMNLWRVKVE